VLARHIRIRRVSEARKARKARKARANTKPSNEASEGGQLVNQAKRAKPSGTSLQPASPQAKLSGQAGEAGKACSACTEATGGAAARKRRGSNKEAQSGLTSLRILLPLLGYHSSAIQERSWQEGCVVRKTQLEYSPLAKYKYPINFTKRDLAEITGQLAGVTAGITRYCSTYKNSWLSAGPCAQGGAVADFQGGARERPPHSLLGTQSVSEDSRGTAIFVNPL
jgi:hypothetical protein